MRQRRWMEYLKDFDFELKYHPRKANKVVDALGRKEMHKVELMMLEYALLEKFQDLNLQFNWTQDGVIMGNLKVTSNLKEEIQQGQMIDEKLQEMSTQPGFTQSPDGVVLFNQRICVPNDVELKRKVLEEAHKGAFTIHPDSSKMYQNLKKDYWWPGMKKGIAKYVSKCIVC
ncbi:uncharacterized protein LOC127105200 [Lathyrus oleraceus]|uniref:uncharacterized protein LOC127105200 n=1 Tax=Pisum sativum TaxID=3888 RepID=UPI0021CFF045|nr:uncharacterized protein LOC127105200 [Pisum sativum]